MRVLHVGKGLRRELLGILFIGPWLLGFLAFGLYPALDSLYYSFTNYTGFGTPDITGFRNYIRMVQDPVFWKAIGNTLYITGLGVPLSIVLGLGIALPLNAKVRGQAIYRTMVYLPVIVPSVVMALLWLWIFNPYYGLLNSILTALHLPTGSWLAAPDQSKLALLIMVLWGTIGSVMVVMLAGLQDVPASLLEAAAIDGASAVQRFRHVVLPALGPVIFYNVITGLIFFLQLFDQAYVVAASGGAGSTTDLGSPVQSTLFYSVYLFQQAFQFQHFGRASAMSWVLLLVTALLTAALFRGARRFIYYEGA